MGHFMGHVQAHDGCTRIEQGTQTSRNHWSRYTWERVNPPRFGTGIALTR